MPPLPADFIHARACKLKCEKILTRPMGEGLWADCGRKNIGFLTPSGTVLGMKKRHRYSSYSVFHEIYLLWGKVSERSIPNGQIGYVNSVLFLNQIVV